MGKGGKSLCRQRESIKYDNKSQWDQVWAKFRDFGRVWSFQFQQDCYKFKLCYLVTMCFLANLYDPHTFLVRLLWPLPCIFQAGCWGSQRRQQTCGPDSLRPWAPWDQEQGQTHVCWVLNKPWTPVSYTLWSEYLTSVLLVMAQFIKTSCFTSWANVTTLSLCLLGIKWEWELLCTGTRRLSSNACKAFSTVLAHRCSFNFYCLLFPKCPPYELG